MFTDDNDRHQVMAKTQVSLKSVKMPLRIIHIQVYKAVKKLCTTILSLP